MHDVLRTRLLRKLESLPEEQVYQVLDYIEFLETKYARDVSEEASGLQNFTVLLNPTSFFPILRENHQLPAVNTCGKFLLQAILAWILLVKQLAHTAPFMSPANDFT